MKNQTEERVVKVENGFAHDFDDAGFMWRAQRLNWADERTSCVHATEADAIRCAKAGEGLR